MTRLSKTVTILLLLTFWSSAADTYGDDHLEHRPRSFAPRPAADPVAEITRLAQVQTLIDLSYPRQGFDLSLEISTDQGSLTRDQRFEIVAHSDRPASLLLLNIDKTGSVSVLYPVHERELEQTLRLEETFEVVPPYGTEYLKLFAFSRPPEGLELWIGRQIDTPTNLDQLLKMLQAPGVASAQTRLKVVTVGELLKDE